MPKTSEQESESKHAEPTKVASDGNKIVWVTCKVRYVLAVLQLTLLEGSKAWLTLSIWVKVMSPSDTSLPPYLQSHGQTLSQQSCVDMGACSIARDC